MNTTAQGYVHASIRAARRREEWACNHRDHGGLDAGWRAAPGEANRRAGPAGAEARGFVVYVGMEETAAAAAGTSLRRLATELRAYVEAVVPGAETTAAVTLAPAGASGTDLEVVRRVLDDPTSTPGAGPAPGHSSVVVTECPGLVVDLARSEVRLDGEPVHLTDKELGILHHLMVHHGCTVRRLELLDSVWEHAGQAPDTRTVDVHIRRLRSKLGRFASTVRTVHGLGYCFHEHPDIIVLTARDCAA